MEKYTLEKRMAIGKRVYDCEISKKEASEEYGISLDTARDYMRLYRKINGMPISVGKQAAPPRKPIFPGEKYGHVTVLEEIEKDRNGRRFLVECECGRHVPMYLSALFHSNDFYCKACATSRANEKRRVVLNGKKRNGWRVLRELPYRDNVHWYECECIRCGNKAIRSAWQINNKKTARCENCSPQYGFVINGESAEGKLPDGTTFLIDVNDIDRVNQYWWHVGKHGYPVADIDGHSISLHRFIIGETDPKIMIDHANRNICDARKSNLRRADTTQNSANHSLFATNQTSYTGVYFSNTSQRYEVKVGYRKRRILLGSSKKNLVRLAQMYNIAASFFFEDFAGALNDVPEADEKLTTAVLKKCRYYKEMLDGTPAKAIA